MTDKQMIDKLKNDIACKENIINHLAEHSIKLQAQLKCKEQECNELKQTLTEIKKITNKVLLNTHDLELFKEADALFGALLEIHKLISEVQDDRQS